MVYREGNGCGAKRYLRRMSSHVAQVNPRVEQLANIAEAGVPKRHVAKPQRAEAQRFCSFGQFDLVEHARSVALEGLQRKE
ncbi:hypothetical protein D9M71_601730 [compost metagenome]